MKIKITAQANIGKTYNITFQVGAKGSDENGNDVEATPTTAAKFEVTAGASATIATSSSSSSVILDGANTELLSFTTTVKDGSFDLNKVEASIKAKPKSNTDSLKGQSITLEID
jgi:hypothetical protein